jgi:hypothetical protein
MLGRIGEKSKDLAEKLDDKNRKRVMAAMMATSLQAGGILHGQRVTTDAEFAAWKVTVTEWHRNTCEQIKNRLSTAHEIIFKQIGGRINFTFNHKFNADHDQWLNEINGYLHNLRELYSRYSPD